MAANTLASIADARFFIDEDYGQVCDRVADLIATLIRIKPTAVLGMATGSTPRGVYERLIRLHQRDGLDFSRVTCFNLDEYYPIESSSEHSYHEFMHRVLFSQINCRQWHVPNGLPRTQDAIAEDCLRYEELIRAVGGIDLQILGIGRTGHIGFNEPGSSPFSRTRLVELDAQTRQDAAPGFGGIDNVPTQAISMGVSTIMEAKQIVLMASGIGKAEIIRAAMYEKPMVEIPATYLQFHPRLRYFLDDAAASLSF